MAALPEHAPRIEPKNRTQSVAVDDSFKFHCHSGLSCFTECCRELDLALSPYDVIRLKQALALTSHEFLERYAVVEFGVDDFYPKVYLAMVDDGRASCPFVDATTGCRVYHDRPGACRTYPVGRGASLDQKGRNQERFILITEGHCLGFAEDQGQTVQQWQNDQQISDYNRFNDLLLPLISQGNGQNLQRLSSEDATLFIDTLYNLELFKSRLPQNSTILAIPSADESTLLPYAIDWLQEQWQSAR